MRGAARAPRRRVDRRVDRRLPRIANLARLANLARDGGLHRAAALLLAGSLAACGGGDAGDRLAALGRDLAAAAEAARPAETPPEAPGTAACPCPDETPDAAAPSLGLTPARFAELPGWGEDALEQALPALVASCRALLAQPDEAPVGPRIGDRPLAGTVADWREPCGGLAEIPADAVVLRTYLESWFRPFLAADASKPAEGTTGLFTGYYEPEVEGALARGGDYVWPLYAPPEDLLRVRLGRFRADLEGQTLFGRLEGQEVVPYHDRAAIDEGHVLAGRGLEIAWLKDYVQLFFLQIQGSGRVLLPDGSRVRVGYAGNNGHGFTAIGRTLLDQGRLASGEATAQGIMAWLRAHPDEAWAVMKQNRRYIFFRRIEGPGPLGAQGVALTPGRSLAVDPAFLALGLPLWLDTTHPGGSEPLRRLVVAQDVGGAIKGPVRGDLFWGAGEAALADAGRMSQRGRYWLLLPAAVAERR